MITHINIHGHDVQLSKRKPSGKWLIRNCRHTSTSGFAEKTFSRVVKIEIRLQGVQGGLLVMRM